MTIEKAVPTSFNSIPNWKYFQYQANKIQLTVANGRTLDICSAAWLASPIWRLVLISKHIDKNKDRGVYKVKINIALRLLLKL